MPKYIAYITYRETSSLELEAANLEEAEEIAHSRMDEAVATGDDDYEIEVEEL